MARKSMVAKQKRKAKFSTREYSRCRICGRPHAYLRKYGICRVIKDKFQVSRRQAGKKKEGGTQK